MNERFDHVLDEVDCYFHDALSWEQRTYLLQHVERCPVCKAALHEAEKRFHLLKNAPPSEPSADLVTRTMRRISQGEKRQLTRQRLLLGACAAIVLAFIGLHIYYANIGPAPYDLRVLGQAQFVPDTEAAVRVALVNEETGAGVNKEPIEVALHNPADDTWTQLVAFNTDKEGTGSPRFRLPDWPEGKYDLRVTANPGGYPQVVTQPISLKRSWKVLLTTDRPVYQPGQTIHARAIALRALDLKPMAGQEAVFSVIDAKANVIFKQKVLTSAFGICAVDCPLDQEIIEGTYTIECTMSDTKSRHDFEVKKYVLPTFRIDVAADRPFYQPGQSVKGTVKADYFFGKPVAGASVEIELNDEAWNFKYGDKLTLTTDDKGEAPFTLPALADNIVRNHEAQLTLTASVVDTAGQKQVRKLPILLTTESLRIEVIPEAGTLVEGLPNKVYFFVRSADGRPAKARIVISDIGRELTTSDLGTAEIEFETHTQEVHWVVKATNDAGQTGRSEVTFKVGTSLDDFILRSDKSVYNAGDTVHLTAIGNMKDAVYVDLLKDGQTLFSQQVPYTGIASECRFDLPLDLYGAIELCAYRLTSYGVSNVKTHVLYIRPPGQLKIAATLDHPEYRPGDHASVQFQLTDKDGKPTPGALGVAAVDEAVFSVLQQTGSVDAESMSTDRALLKPIYELYPWSPTAVANGPDDQQLERALFARADVQKMGGREEIIKKLLPYAENSRRIFDVLDNPDIDKWLEGNEGIIPKEYLDLLRGKAVHFDLYRDSYVENVRAALETKAKINTVLSFAWLVISASFGLWIFIWSVRWMGKSNVAACIVTLMVLFILAVLLIPSVQKVREASFRTQSLNDVKQIALAFESYKDGHKKLPSAAPDERGGNSSPAPRLREWFPETLLWRPEIITDDQGRARLDIPLADSITTWRLTTSAVTKDGRLGAGQDAIKVFQPFFIEIRLPVALTRGDEVAVPVVVYNYLDQTLDVELTLSDAAWFARLDDGPRKLSLEPRAVRSTFFRVRADKVGRYDFRVTALSAGISDAVQRRVDVLPGGRRVETVLNGNLDRAVSETFTLPTDAIPDSGQLLLKYYPSRFSQVVEGLDSIFQMPYGCFEQTSSCTYPNVLALEYLQRTKKNSPAIEATARNLIHLGYQRLLGFEVPGGGFDWFGNPPANRTLTAYGLMEFQDMARVHNVDPRLIERTRKWLLDQRKPDGTWDAEGHTIHDLPAGMSGDNLARLSTTAYIAWAVFNQAEERIDATATRSYLLAQRPEVVSDPYVLALMSNALLAIDSTGRDAAPYLDRLMSLRKRSADNAQIWWEQDRGMRTSFYGQGRAGNVETTALTVLASLRAGRYADNTRAALTWLNAQRQGNGNWYSTQATVLALKAILTASDGLPEGRERRITWNVGARKETVTIPADQCEVVKQIDLSSLLSTGANALSLSEATGLAAGYQVMFRYHVAEDKKSVDDGLSLAIAYDKETLNVGETLAATARIGNHSQEPVPMILVELPIPPGFSVKAEDFAKWADEKRIAKYEVRPQAVIVYLRGLAAGETLEVPYHLSATMSAQVTVPAGRVYEYYNPDRQAFAAVTKMVVRE